MQNLHDRSGPGVGADRADAPFNLAEYVLAEGIAQPHKTALVILGPEDDVWTYGRLLDAVRGTATGLTELGLNAGDRVLLRLGNGPDFPVAFLGCIAAGLIPVPTSSQLTVPEITKIATEIAPALIIAGDAIALPHHFAPVLNSTRIDAFCDLAPGDWARGDPNRPAYIIYTSGTSGKPRAVVHAHRAILARRMMWDGWYGLHADDRLLHAGAFNWTYTLGTGLMDPWTRGATALIPAVDTKPTELPDLLARARATIFAAAPGVFRQMLKAPIPLLPHLRHGLSAGEKMSPAIKSDWKAATGTAVHEAFGMSECSTFLSGCPDRPAPDGTLGYAQPGRRITLLDGTAEVGIGGSGVIAVHRSDPGLMLGYLDQPEETAARFEGEWFLTGDIGLMEPSGAIAYLGRNDDMMNAGGTRVSPVEVESVMASHPGISEVAACELQVKSDASVIAAFWSGPSDLEVAELAAFAAARLARYKCPRLFIRVEHLPRGANNKLLRRKLRRDWESEHGPT